GRRGASPGRRSIRISARAAGRLRGPPRGPPGQLVHDAGVGSHGRHAAGVLRFLVAALADELAPVLGPRPRKLAVLLDPHELTRRLAHHGGSALEGHYSIAIGEFGDSETLLLGQLHP